MDRNPDHRIIRHMYSTHDVLRLALGPRLGRPPSHTDKSSCAHGEHILNESSSSSLKDDSIRFSWSASFRLHRYIRAQIQKGFICYLNWLYG